MSIITWIILGLIAGAIAKAIMPGADPGGGHRIQAAGERDQAVLADPTDVLISHQIRHLG